MKKVIAAFILVLALSSVSWAKGKAGPDFTLINNSGKTIVNIYLSPSEYDDWAAEDELIDRPLRHGEAVEIDLYHIYEMGIERGGASSYRTAY